MIRLRLGPGDLERLRFAYSPLAEVAESLYVLHSGQIPTMHRPWFDRVRQQLQHVDTTVLRAIVPAPRPHVASFLLAGAREPATSIDAQLRLVAGYPPERLRADLEVVWRGELPAATQGVLRDGGARIAEVLRQYWEVAVEPYWPQIRAVLDADVAYRAARLAGGGIAALLSDLHPELELSENAITVESSAGREHHLRGAGLVLVPCVFAWPHVMADFGGGDTAPSITYGPRGVGDLWSPAEPRGADGDALGALMGRSRAAILLRLGRPASTSDIARDLGQSMPAVSAHLAVLRRSGLVTSWRAGRRVLNQRTALATSVAAASGALQSDSASELA